MSSHRQEVRPTPTGHTTRAAFLANPLATSPTKASSSKPPTDPSSSAGLASVAGQQANVSTPTGHSSRYTSFNVAANSEAQPTPTGHSVRASFFGDSGAAKTTDTKPPTTPTGGHSSRSMGSFFGSFRKAGEKTANATTPRSPSARTMKPISTQNRSKPTPTSHTARATFFGESNTTSSNYQTGAAQTPTGHSSAFYGLDYSFNGTKSTGDLTGEDSSVDYSTLMDVNSASSRGPRTGGGGGSFALSPRGGDFDPQMAVVPEERIAPSSSSPRSSANGPSVAGSVAASSPEIRVNNSVANENNDNSNKDSPKTKVATMNILDDLQSNENIVQTIPLKGSSCTSSFFIHKQDSTTLHASNVINVGGNVGVGAGIDDADNDYSLHYAAMPEDDNIVAWSIHIALGFFFTVAMVAAFMAYFIAETYGFITLVFVSLFVVFCVFLAMFVDQTILSQNETLRPVRRKIAVVAHAAKEAVFNEYQLFQQEWNEYNLLLTNGEAGEDVEEEPEREQATGVPHIPIPKRKKSVIFKFVKPFVGLHRKFVGRRRRRGGERRGTNANKATNTPPSPEGNTSYAPPPQNAAVTASE